MTPAVLALESTGVDFTVHEYEHGRRTGGRGAPQGFGIEAAGALGLDPDQVFKTLVVVADGELVVVVAPVSATVSMKRVASAVGTKRAALADPAVAERSTGYVVGGISPIGQRTRLRSVVDETAAAFDTIYVSAGRRGLEISLAPGDLVRILDAVVADVVA